MSMEEDTQNEDGDFRGLTFSRIEGEGLGELSSSTGPGWRSFLVFDPKIQRLARLSAVDLDRETRRRETEVTFGAKRSHRAFETIFDHGQDDDSLYFVSSLRLESEPLVDYLEREAPLKPMHGFELIEHYLEALRDSGGFELAPEGLGFFIAERLRISTEADGSVRLVFCGFGAADDQDSKLLLQERIAALASRMGLGFSVEDLPKKSGLGEFLKWMESFRGDLPKEDQPVSKPESEIRKWLGENKSRRDAICEKASKGMADLVPHFESDDDVKEAPASVPDPKAEKAKALEEAKKAKEAAEAAAVEKAKMEPKPEVRTKEAVLNDPVISPKETSPKKNKAIPEPGKLVEKKGVIDAPPVIDEVTLLQRFQDRMRDGNDTSDDDVKDLLPGYQDSRQRRSSPMALAFIFCTVAAILIWLVSLNLEFVADSVSKMLGKSREPRSGFQEYQPEVRTRPEDAAPEKTVPSE
ncbi:MAG: hypothetical protein ACKVJU_19520 [Verrucomicrobiales bacterium]